MSLFPHEETEESKKNRDSIMEKILKTAEIKQKIRDKEIEEADEEIDDDYILKKDIPNKKLDSFFKL